MHPMTTNTPGMTAFARRAIEFEFWLANRPFAAIEDDDGSMAREVRSFYVSAAISVLGRSEDSDIPQLLKKLRTRDINYTYHIAGALVDAAAEQDRKKQSQAQPFPASDRGAEGRWFKYWVDSTQNGKDWSKWAAGISKQRPTYER